MAPPVDPWPSSVNIADLNLLPYNPSGFPDPTGMSETHMHAASAGYGSFPAAPGAGGGSAAAAGGAGAAAVPATSGRRTGRPRSGTNTPSIPASSPPATSGSGVFASVISPASVGGAASAQPDAGAEFAASLPVPTLNADGSADAAAATAGNVHARAALSSSILPSSSTGLQPVLVGASESLPPAAASASLGGASAGASTSPLQLVMLPEVPAGLDVQFPTRPKYKKRSPLMKSRKSGDDMDSLYLQYSGEHEEDSGDGGVTASEAGLAAGSSAGAGVGSASESGKKRGRKGGRKSITGAAASKGSPATDAGANMAIDLTGGLYSGMFHTGAGGQDMQPLHVGGHLGMTSMVMPNLGSATADGYHVSISQPASGMASEASSVAGDIATGGVSLTGMAPPAAEGHGKKRRRTSTKGASSASAAAAAGSSGGGGADASSASSSIPAMQPMVVPRLAYPPQRAIGVAEGGGYAVPGYGPVGYNPAPSAYPPPPTHHYGQYQYPGGGYPLQQHQHQQQQDSQQHGQGMGLVSDPFNQQHQHQQQQYHVHQQQQAGMGLVAYPLPAPAQQQQQQHASAGSGDGHQQLQQQGYAPPPDPFQPNGGSMSRQGSPPYPYGTSSGSGQQYYHGVPPPPGHALQPYPTYQQQQMQHHQQQQQHDGGGGGSGYPPPSYPYYPQPSQPFASHQQQQQSAWQPDSYQQQQQQQRQQPFQQFEYGYGQQQQAQQAAPSLQQLVGAWPVPSQLPSSLPTDSTNGNSDNANPIGAGWMTQHQQHVQQHQGGGGGGFTHSIIQQPQQQQHAAAGARLPGPVGLHVTTGIGAQQQQQPSSSSASDAPLDTRSASMVAPHLTAATPAPHRTQGRANGDGADNDGASAAAGQDAGATAAASPSVHATGAAAASSSSSSSYMVAAPTPTQSGQLMMHGASFLSPGTIDSPEAASVLGHLATGMGYHAGVVAGNSSSSTASKADLLKMAMMNRAAGGLTPHGGHAASAAAAAGPSASVTSAAATAAGQDEVSASAADAAEAVNNPPEAAPDAAKAHQMIVGAGAGGDGSTTIVASNLDESSSPASGVGVSTAGATSDASAAAAANPASFGGYASYPYAYQTASSPGQPQQPAAFHPAVGAPGFGISASTFVAGQGGPSGGAGMMQSLLHPTAGPRLS